MKRKFYDACINGNMTQIINIISKKKFDYDLGLHYACQGGHVEIIELMIEKGATNFNKALSGACRGGHLEIINLIIKKGATDFNEGLSGACTRQDLEIVNLMIEKGATNFNEGLVGACYGGNWDIINLMIERGADDFDRALWIAGAARQIDIISFFMKKNPININMGLLGATYQGHIDIAKFMIDQGAMINFIHLEMIDTRQLLSIIVCKCPILCIDKKMTTNDGISLLLERHTDQIDQKNLELIQDYQNNFLWRPNKRHIKFPEDVQKKICQFMLSIKIFSDRCLGQKIPKPLLWIIINLFIME